MAETALYNALQRIEQMAMEAQSLDVVEMSRVFDRIEVAACRAIRQYRKEQGKHGGKRLRRQQDQPVKGSDGTTDHLRVERPENGRGPVRREDNWQPE